MTITISGNSGSRFNITETNTDITVGNSTVTYSVDSSISDLTLTNSDKVIAFYGTIGTTPIDLNLQALTAMTGGVDTITPAKTTTPISLNSIKTILVHNKAASGTIVLNPGTANPFFPASEKITVQAGCAIALEYAVAQTVDASTKTIKFTGSVNALSVELFLLGA